MKRLLVLLVLMGVAVSASVALATPGKGQTSTILSVGTLSGDVAFATGIAAEASGVTWGTKKYTADQLPELLIRLRAQGVTNLGEWLNLHPGVSAKFGLVPIGRAPLAGDRHAAGQSSLRVRIRAGTAIRATCSRRSCPASWSATARTVRRRRLAPVRRSTRPARTRSSSRTRATPMRSTR